MRLNALLAIGFMLLFLTGSLFAQTKIKLKKKDRKRDIELLTTQGSIILRLSDSTPMHRDNYLRLVKSHFYDSILFHRVIQNFVIQGGDPKSRDALAGQVLGDSSAPYTISRNSGYPCFTNGVCWQRPGNQTIPIR
jgi:peptidyl-prolyl cis-trans isomerase B (cyclophilin B)